MDMILKAFLKCLFLIFISNITYAQNIISYNNPDSIIKIGNKVLLLEDKNNKLTINEALNSNLFIKSNQTVPNFQISKSTFWIKFKIKNNTSLKSLLLELPYPTIDSISFLSLNSNNTYTIEKTGEYVPFYLRLYHHQNYIFNLSLAPFETKTYILKVRASEQMQLPLLLGSEKYILESLHDTDLYFGVYAGIIIAMLFYNLFLYFIVKDNTYILYVFYILFVGLTQGCILGYTSRYLYPNSIFLSNFLMILIPAMSGVCGLFFVKSYLAVKKTVYSLIKYLNLFLLVYGIIIFLGILGYYQLANLIMQVNAGLLSFFGFFIGYKAFKNGYKPALFFLIAWSVFLLSVIIYVLKNLNVLPYNNFTLYALQIGSALEVILLSFALADKINIYKKEKEESQAQAMASLQDKERIVSEQNITLENKVKVRTTELTTTNTNLQKTLTDLKEAQAQLVEAEKMASLGQLTAGIAHEINNPINFVTANVGPLKRDMELLIDAVQNIENLSLAEGSVEEKQQQMEDYKEEIDFDYLKTEINYLLKGIHEGASRTADIVKGLKIFSRLDEGDLKKADINEGLESTLIIANNLIGKKIQVIKNFGDIPVIECYPGKLNQVFLNIISNAVFAISEKFGDKPGGILKITTECDTHKLFIKIEDNGTGMSEAIKNKIYEPFFTTKDVGVGTGLGMSIVHNTIKKHNGQIYLNSAEGVGTEFILELHLIFEENIADYQSEHN